MRSTMDGIRNFLRTLARPFALKVGSKPLGIWFAWLMLAYAAIEQRDRLFMLAEDPAGRFRLVSYALINWPVLIIAIVALIMRRQITQVFGGIVCANLMIHTIYHLNWFGTAIGVFGFAGLLINRRWFTEKLPNVLK